MCRSKIQGDVSKIVTRGEDVPVEDDVKAAEERSRKAKAEFDKKHSEFERYKAQSEEKRAELVKNLQKRIRHWLTDIWRTRLKRRKGRSSRRLLRENRPKKM